MLIVRNHDIPGMVGIVGTMVGDAGSTSPTCTSVKTPMGSRR